MVLFLAICGSVFQNTAIQKISSVLPGVSPADMSQLVAGTSSSVYQALSATERGAVVAHIADAMGNVWILFTAAAGLSFLLSLPLVVSILHAEPSCVVSLAYQSVSQTTRLGGKVGSG